MSPSTTPSPCHKHQTSTSTGTLSPKSKVAHVSGFDELTRRTLNASRKTVTLVDASKGEAPLVLTARRNILIAFSLVANDKLSTSPTTNTVPITLSHESHSTNPVVKGISTALDAKALEFIITWVTSCCDHTLKFAPPPYPSGDFLALLRILLFSSRLDIGAIGNDITPLIKEHITLPVLSSPAVEFIWHNFPSDAPIVTHMLHQILRHRSSSSSSPSAATSNGIFTSSPSPPRDTEAEAKLAIDDDYLSTNVALANTLSALEQDITEAAAKAKEREEKRIAWEKGRHEYLARKANRQERAEAKRRAHEAYLIREERRQERQRKQEEWERKQRKRESGKEYLLKPGQRTRAGLIG